MDRSPYRPLRLLLGPALLLLAGCEPDAPEPPSAEAPLVAFDTTRICILTDQDTLRLAVEVAATEAQRAYGLMERPGLASEAGMLFTYDAPQPAESGFWMYRTRIPLDIAFVGPEGEIRSVQAMEPCTSPDPRWCPTYAAGAVYQAALEMNRGFFAARGVEVGDTVRRAGEPGCPAAPAAP